MNMTANCGPAMTRSPQHPCTAITCRECGTPLTKGLLLQNSIWVTPIPADRAVARRLSLWLLGGLFQKHKVNAWRCASCGRVEMIAR